MPYHASSKRLTTILAGFCAVSLFLQGCAQLGPKSISRGRAAYNEAITKTDDEQLLMSIVRGRYGETYNMLAITGVAANLRFRASAEAQVGIGPSQNYAENLVPFGAGVAYEENPTITYAPAQGAEFLRQLHSPIPLEVLVLLARTSRNPGDIISLMVESINDLRNPEFLPPDAKPDADFSQFVRLSTDLAEVHVLHWVRDPTLKNRFYFVLSGHDPKYAKDIELLLSLLGLPMPENRDRDKDIVFPVSFALRGKEWGGIGITTRAPVELVEIMQAQVEVPGEHATTGVAITYPPVGLPGQGIHIPSSKERPGKAWVAVKYRGYWFYIDETDQPTKRAFKAVSTMVKASIATAAEQQPAPILTVPVSR